MALDIVARWITDVRSEAVEAATQATWQNVVDALGAAGNRALAPYSESRGRLSRTKGHSRIQRSLSPRPDRLC